jgi:UDP-glucose 4-epimerase
MQVCKVVVDRWQIVNNGNMNYIIQTPNARWLKEEIVKSAESKADANGNGIATWQCVETDICDLASGHVAALSAINKKCGLAIYNLGTGHGYSVLDVVKTFEKVNCVKVPYSFKPRRPGDIATCNCNPAKAKVELGWEARYGIEEMCRDSWNWQKNNPEGY